jgi:AraC family transcriptional activator of pobA
MASGPSFLRKPGKIHDTAAVPRRIRCENIGKFTRGAPWRISDLHDRDTDLLIWITKGQGRVNIGGVLRGYGSHNAIFLPAGTLFGLELTPQSLASVIEAPAGMMELPKRQPEHVRCRDSLAQAELTAEIEAMSREIGRDRLYLTDSLEAHLRLATVWLRRKIAEGAADRPKDTATQRLARRFSDLVVREFRSDRVMADYAGALGVTPTHLTRVCRAASGKTAAEIITERKLYEARVMLGQAEPPISGVAEALGFHSAAYFTRFVQSHTGQTPSSLRKRALTTGRA